MAEDRKYSIAEWANLRGIAYKNAKKCAERHNIHFDEDGKAYELEWLQATLDGKLKDKSLISSNTPTTIDPFKAKKIEKLDREIKKLDLHIEALKGKLIPVDEFRSTLLLHCSFVSNLSKHIINEISVKYRDSEILQTVTDCINKALEEEKEKVSAEIEKLEKDGCSNLPLIEGDSDVEEDDTLEV